MIKWSVFLSIAFFSGTIVTYAQSPAKLNISLREAVSKAEENYPQLKAVRYEADAASKQVEVARYNKLPTIDASLQSGLATANNVTGMFYPNGLLPISGPPSSSNSYAPTVGSAASLLLNWDIVTFGKKDAQINTAIAEAKAQKANYRQLLFQHKIKVISTYLDLLLSYDYLQIYQKNVERTKVNLDQSEVLSKSGIKPGVDTALFSSELSKSKVVLQNAIKEQQVQQFLLAKLMVLDATPVPVDSAFISNLPFLGNGSGSLENNPTILYAESELALNKTKEQEIKKSFLPKLSLWSTAFARGSGIRYDGSTNFSDGFSLNRFNYGVGVQLSFPIMKYGESRKQLQQQNLLTEATKEKINDSKLAVETQSKLADVTFTNNISIAKETEQQLKSAQYAFSAMQTRYKTGLVNYADLIQAHYNLLNAELDNKKAHWEAWKALLYQAAVLGDENIFINAIQ